MSGIVVVANPAAGGGRAAAAVPKVITALRAARAEFDVVTSRDLAHAIEVAGKAAAEGALVAALGGDGLFGALAGPVAAAGGLLGVLPGGRGNDVARTLGVPFDPQAAVRVLLGGAERRLDLGEAGGRTFVGVASVGFDSEANRIANASRLVRGRLVYPYATLRTLASWRPASFEVTIDGTVESYVGYLVSVANLPSYGGGMKIAPHADPADGQLDVIMSHAVSKARFLLTAPKIFSGRHLEEPSVHEARGREVRVDADRPFTVYADGDPLCTLPCTVTLRPGALRVIGAGPAAAAQE